LALTGEAWAESSDVNLHLEPSIGLGFGFTEGASPWGSGAAFKLDSPWLGIGPVAPQLQAFGLSYANHAALNEGSAFGFGVGLRVRLLDDHEGYLIHLGREEGHKGNFFGNLWVDAHATYAAQGLGLGFDAAVGAESSLVDGLQVGPFLKYTMNGPVSGLFLGLSLTIGVPDAQVHEADPDKDGVKGAADKCPDVPEDKDGFGDEDGCPDPDNDKDGVLDAADRCPNEAGPAENQGCPDFDTDGDGFVDRLDKCPTVFGIKENDGCPDVDTDKDGIVDRLDKCPTEPEDKDGFQDEDGCPDLDNDQDGVPDAKDRCPNDPETINGIDDEDGCPEVEVKVFIEKQRIVITEKVFFEFAKARILPKSDALLKAVADVLTRFPQITKVRVEGHTDDQGSDKVNQTLSDKRAQSVMDALVKNGVDKARLSSAGYGKTKPMVEGKDEAAREKNRRVEFVIVEPADGVVPTGKTTTVDPDAKPAAN
jgi:outer membrane protein OmpA-like peptidoglycan-associated protein